MTTSNNPFEQFGFVDDPADVPTAASAPNPFDEFGFVEEEEPELQQPQDSTFGSRTAENFDKAAGRSAETFKEWWDTPIADKMTEAHPAVETLGADWIPFASDMLMDGGLTLAQTVLPEDWQDAIVDFGRDTWEQISSNDLAKAGIEKAKEGYEAYSEWAKENPDAARRLEAGVNVGSLFFAGPKNLPTAKYVDQSGKAAVRGAGAKVANNRLAQIQDNLTPVGMKGPKGSTIKMEGKGLRKKKVYDPSQFEKDVYKEIAKVREYKPKSLFHTEKMEVLRTRASLLRDELDDFVLNQSGNPKINTKNLKTSLANRVNSINETSSLVGNAQTHAIKMYGKMAELIDASDGTAYGLLQARRKFDNWITETKPKGFDSDYFNAYGWAMRPMRETLNEAVTKSTNSTRVKTLLNKQHKLLSGADMIEPKAYAEADGTVRRFIQKLEEATGEKLPTTPVAQKEVARHAIQPVAATLGAGAMTLMSGYKGIKWLTTVGGRRWLGQLGQMAAEYPILMPEYNLLVQMAGGLNPEQEEAE